MTEPTHTISRATAADITATNQAEAAPAPTLIDEELLVEEISIDGMCGVY